jgi:hypothetical protein
MKNHIPLVEQYYVQQKEHVDKKGTETETLKSYIKQAKEVLHALSLSKR